MTPVTVVTVMTVKTDTGEMESRLSFFFCSILRKKANMLPKLFKVHSCVVCAVSILISELQMRNSVSNPVSVLVLFW